MDQDIKLIKGPLFSQRFLYMSNLRPRLYHPKWSALNLRIYIMISIMSWINCFNLDDIKDSFTVQYRTNYVHFFTVLVLGYEHVKINVNYFNGLCCVWDLLIIGESICWKATGTKSSDNIAWIIFERQWELKRSIET